MNEAPPPDGHRTLVLRVVVIALAAVILCELTIVIGHGVMCIIRSSCAADEWATAGEMLGALLATLIALIFALIEGRKP